MYRHLILLLLLMFFCCCSSNVPNSTSTKAPVLSQNVDFATQPGEWGKPVRGLVSSIVVHNTNWIEPNPATVTVFIKNVSGNKMEIRPFSVFHLEKTMDPEEKKKNREAYLKSGTPVEGSGCGDSYLNAIMYYCPFDFNNPTVTPEPNAISPLTLGVDETKQLTVNLTPLYWGRTIAALWPSTVMHQAVSPGEYELTFIMEVSSGKQIRVGKEMIPGVECIYSNKLIIEVASASN